MLWVWELTRTWACESIFLHRNLMLYFWTTNEKNGKKKPLYEWKRISFMCDLLIFSSRSFSYEFGDLLIYFCFFSLLIKHFGHLNLSVLRISSHSKWEFLTNTKNVMVFSVVLCGANETSEFLLGGRSSSSTYIIFSRSEIQSRNKPQNRQNMWDRLGCLIGNFTFLQIMPEFFNVYKKRGAFNFCVNLNFSLHFCYYFENDLDLRKPSKILLKTWK